MGFAAGNVTARRYFVEGRISKELSKATVERLQRCAFGAYESSAPDLVEVGWVCPTHLFDIEFSLDKIALSRFVYVWMRMDRKQVPGGVLKSYVRQEEEAARLASGRRKLTKAELEQAREAAKSKADQEAQEGRFRRISAIPVVWDLDSSFLYFGNMGSTAHEKLLALFTDTFGGRLEPADAGRVAGRRSNTLGAFRSFEDAAPFHLVESSESNGAGAVDLAARHGDFLGREFLSWLWFHGDQREGVFDVGQDRVTVALHRSMRLECDYKQTGSDMISCDDPSRAPEARAALTTGKQPTRVGLLIGATKGEWSCTISAASLAISGLKLSEPKEADRSARIEQRLIQVRDLFTALDELYGSFLAERLNGHWAGTAGRLRAWAQGRAIPARQPRLATA